MGEIGIVNAWFCNKKGHGFVLRYGYGRKLRLDGPGMMSLRHVGIIVLLACGLCSMHAFAGLNPASPGLPAVDNIYGRNGIPNNNASSMCIACHRMVPVAAMTTHFVSHYSSNDSANRTTTTDGKNNKERTAAWTGSGRSSKYARDIGTNPSSDNTQTGELICESCHNLVRNVVGGNNLLESSLPADPRPIQPNTLTSATTTLCEGCHVSATIPGHHPMTNDTTSDGSSLSTSDSIFTRGYTSPNAELGGIGSDVRFPSANTLPCISCHGNGHGGYTGSGARILRRGYNRDPNHTGQGVTGIDSSGIDRQYDIDQTGGNRLITNYSPLCDACHKVND